MNFCSLVEQTGRLSRITVTFRLKIPNSGTELYVLISLLKSAGRPCSGRWISTGRNENLAVLPFRGVGVSTSVGPVSATADRSKPTPLYLDHYVHNPLRHHDDFLRRFTVQPFLHNLIGQHLALNFGWRTVDGEADCRANFAVDLNRILERVFN